MKRLALVLFALLAGRLAGEERPNFLFISVDDLNHWVGYTARNPQVRTPNIDRLSSRGVSFANAHCAAPACEPSRAALMSGLRPFTSGCYLNGDDWRQRIKPGLGLTHFLREAGYRALGRGKIYHGNSHHPSEWDLYPDNHPAGHGKGVRKYEAYFEPLEHELEDEDIDDWHTVEWCIGQLKQEHEKPFFLACGLHKPHLPFAVPRKYYEPFPADSIELPPHRRGDLADIPPAGRRMAKPRADHAKFLENGRWKDAIASYLATVAYTDMNIGRLLDALEASPHADNTIIVLWGDHGWSFGEKEHWRKFALWEETTRCPLIWVAPGIAPPTTVCSRPVDLMSIFPTICELAGIAVPAHVEGESLVPLLKDPFAEWKGVALTTHGRRNHAVRDQRWRYIRYADGSEELYDHDRDPYEWTNLAGDQRYAPTIRKLGVHLPGREAQGPARKR